MDYARKRKFKTLLDGLGTRSSTSDLDNITSGGSPSSIRTTASASVAMTQPPPPPPPLAIPGQERPRTSAFVSDLLAKRRRVGGLNPTSAQASTAATSAGSPTTISNIVLRKWSVEQPSPIGGGGGGGSDSGSPAKSNQPQYRYCPDDRDQLIRRLATFQELTDWTPKPDRVSEIEWAKKGWMCNGKERVRCTLCNKELVVKLNRKQIDGKETTVLIASEIEEALVEKYVQLITESHNEDCLWVKKGCEDTLLRLSLANPKIALAGLRRRYDELCVRKDFLPYEFNIRLPDSIDLQHVVRQLPPNFFSDPVPPPTNPPGDKPSMTALALALAGWQGLSNARIGPVPNTSSCHTCLRRLGLWMFKSKEIDQDTNQVIVPAPMDHLDPVREHRPWCPWKNGSMQRNPGAGRASRIAIDGSEMVDQPGWMLLVQVLKNEAYLRQRTLYGRPVAAAGKHRPPGSADADATSASVVGDGPPQTPVRPSATTTTTTTTTAAAGQLGNTPGARDAAASPAPTMATDIGVGDINDDYDNGDDGSMIEDEKTRAVKDKERWARLRRVKSMLNTKGSRKLKKSLQLSRPGTGQSVREDGNVN